MKENSIEEDIEYAKDVIALAKLLPTGEIKIQEEEIEVIEHILSDYKRVLKENEELRKNIEGWKKYCEEIEEEQIEKNNKNCELEFEAEKLQKENKELKKSKITYEKVRDIQEKNKNIVDKNYISKQIIKDKQIDKLKKHNDDLLRKLRNRVKEVKKLEKYRLYKKEFSRLNKQLQNKEKIIDLMAEHIATSDSDLCEYLDMTTKCKYYAGDNGKTCDSCIKQYFENESKELLNK